MTGPTGPPAPPPPQTALGPEGEIDFLMTRGLWGVDELRDQSPQRRLWVPREGRTPGEDGGRGEKKAGQSGVWPLAL